MRTKNKFLRFCKQLFCKHRWAYNHKHKYHRCKNCELKIEDYENN